LAEPITKKGEKQIFYGMSVGLADATRRKK